jgi:hypothetical protein
MTPRGDNGVGLMIAIFPRPTDVHFAMSDVKHGIEPEQGKKAAGLLAGRRIQEAARQERGQPCPRELDPKPETRGHGCPRSNIESALSSQGASHFLRSRGATV